ncbi:mucin-6-like [Spinachia spinachia]
MTTQGWILAFCFSLASVFAIVELFETKETQTYTCRTFGSGVFEPFNGKGYYVRSDCPFTLTSFTVNRGEYSVTIRRGNNGLLVYVEIIIKKVTTLLHNGHILVHNKSVSLPYDHTYQHIFKYGIYTRLRSTLLPFTVTWHNVHGGINSMWVTLESELSTDMSGLCGKQNTAGHKHELIRDSKLDDHRCKTRDPVWQKNHVCGQFFRRTKNCLQENNFHYHRLCQENILGFENSPEVFCPFFQEVARECNQSRIKRFWRRLTRCEKPCCQGDLIYEKKGPAFIPSCSNPNPAPFYQELTETCVCPRDKVFNNLAIGHHCIPESSCSCEFAGKIYGNGKIRSSKCQSCMCHGGKWRCTENLCHRRCVIEGQFVTTFDGKQYVLPHKCLYVASKELFVFKKNKVVFEGREITEFHQSDHAQVYWLSSMFVQVHTTLGIDFQIQVSPDLQLFIDAPNKSNDKIKGLCGNSNSDTTDDFTANSGIIENSAQPFALSWSLGLCHGKIPTNCTNHENENYAHEKCAELNEPTGLFAECHPHIPTDFYHTACIQRICNSGRSRGEALCIGLASYAKACDGLGVVIGDWRTNTGCGLKCEMNQEFSYSTHTCNRTCTSLSGHDIRCDMDDDPVEGCGCPEGTYLDQEQICSPKKECACTYYGGRADPGPVVISGHKCNCENGVLSCLPDCDCRKGKVCVSCSEDRHERVQKNCDYIGKPIDTSEDCESGCFCPAHLYEDHHGNCVSLDECTCVFSGKAFSAGQQVNSNCNPCTCYRGQWHCIDKPCPGQCQVYGDGHYQTFDSKWYRFSGQCLYTLVQDACGNKNGTFSVRVESVPCSQKELICSRNIILQLQGQVTLTLSDMQVTSHLHKGWTWQDDSLYSIHTLGLYIVISVPSKGITLIWDKHTWITIELTGSWKNRVCGLCGNFDSNERNDLVISGSSVSGRLAYGNSWKVLTPPCSDVTTEIFPCERNSYCTAWAQQRCMILTRETFSECHLKVHPHPYYVACVQESCSCELDGKFLGFCTAVAAYAQACSEQDVCVKWRTSDLCPIACDYYNEKGKCVWQYEACGEILTCGKANYIPLKLEGSGRCEIYGDSYYTTFDGVKFNFLTECTNILVKEISSHPSLFISVENDHCVAGRHRSCAKSITLKYQGSKVVLSIHPDFSEVKVTLNGAVIKPPIQVAGFRFESTVDTVTVYIPEVRSYVSLNQSHSLVVSLAMEYFQGKTQGQCGSCGVGSCIRKGGKIEDNSCCDKTAYSWVEHDKFKPACAHLPRYVECHQTTAAPTTTIDLPCPSSALCVVLDHPAFSNCIKNLKRKKKICVYGSCDIDRCSILTRAAKECMNAGVCIDWRALTNGKCTITCPKGLVYRQCRDKLDDFCFKGFDNCKGPLGEPKQPGDVWLSGCHICKCDKHTGREECHLKSLETETSCGPGSVLVNKPCCGEQICVQKTCKFGKKTYQVGENWSDDSSPCQSYHCTLEGIQTTIRECPHVHCHPARLIWDDHKCCKTCNNTCAPVYGDVEFITTDCHTILHVPVCMGKCGSGLSIKVGKKLMVKAQNNCCQEKTWETKKLSAICYHPVTNRRQEKTFTYEHITSCECTQH